MKARSEFHQRAEKDERYAPHAFDRCVGQEVPFKIEGVERGQATVVAVQVDEDGRGATWTVDIESDAQSETGEESAGHMSFRLPEIPAWMQRSW